MNIQKLINVYTQKIEDITTEMKYLDALMRTPDYHLTDGAEILAQQRRYEFLLHARMMAQRVLTNLTADLLTGGDK